MREFFRGWRRKVGCVTLVMACVLCSGWVRSVSVVDMIEFPTGKHTLDAVCSTIGSIVLQRTRAEGAVIGESYPIWHTFPTTAESFFGDPSLQWRWRCCGFGVAESPPEQTLQIGISTQFVFVPYWSVTIPLTLLSAYLILWKPHHRTEPHHA